MLITFISLLKKVNLIAHCVLLGRGLITGVKQGRRYFHMLHQEEEARKIEVQDNQRQLHERNKTEPRPFRDSDEDSSADEQDISTSTHKTRLFFSKNFSKIYENIYSSFE